MNLRAAHSQEYLVRALSWLTRPERNALCAKLQCAGGVGHIHKEIQVFVDNLDIFKTSRSHGADQVCIQQTAGNSTRPQGDVLQCVLWNRARDHNVANLQASAGFENAKPLA